MIRGDEDPVELSIALGKLCYIIVKAREFDAKVEPVNPEASSSPADDTERDILEDYAGDPTLEELTSAIQSLNDDEVVDLIAIAWVGRGDFGRDSFEEARALARERHRPDSAPYLVGSPMLSDDLEEGLGALGYSCEEVELQHL
jgi:hypothetical protein